MYTRIDRCLDELAAKKRAALIPFITAGDPSVAATVPVMHALVVAGADIIELGVPFSDPMADGPVIQQSSERALARKVGLRSVLSMVSEFRQSDQTTPVVLMGYLNPVEMFGLDRFAEAASLAGVDGVLLVDCPPEESAPVRVALNSQQLALVPLAAPTSAGERLRQLADDAQGYLYYVSFAGVTGAGKLDLADVQTRVAAIRSVSQARIAVGFGVRDADSAKRIAAFADAIVIGSALVSSLASAESTAIACARAEAFLRPIAEALRAGQGE
ncbi:MAG: tryptophan synthase subunit alpha [Xanthomonadales bacterium]|nr:tryptophan synthase subunit alpha [Xanthomonadales bacterium]